MTISTAIIPARLASTRLPRKVLAELCGKPLIQHVWERVSQAKNIDDVIIATDAPEVMQAAVGWGGKTLLTDPNCQSGTERIAADRFSARPTRCGFDSKCSRG